ncbi:ATPase [Glutamicibacter sp. BW80]|uniref:SRPBCC domain-containing protein n=1 Tax=unclassified Glutamicibacter TaxID=2627139 RepID=UPI000BB8064F|nr:SRPBCC domain-containing protein [Glutamicibacter sp. BW80]PCC27408.1 ATPase [Glutamicibacter sp. BW80]
METNLPSEPLSFDVTGRISTSCHEVYEAVADPEKLSAYFTTGGAQGRLETGAEVSWDFHDFPGRFPVQVLEAIPDERIVLKWAGEGVAADDGLNTVTFEFESIDGDARTKVKITESGWLSSPQGLTGAFGNCEGWTGMLCAMKVWLEHGINLREGFYK